MEKTIKGSDLMVFVGGKSIALATSHTLSITADSSELEHKDTEGDFADVQINKMSWEATTENLCSVNPKGITYEDLWQLMMRKQKVSIMIDEKEDVLTDDGWMPEVKSTKTGEAYITSLTINAPSGDNLTFSCTFSGIGKLVGYTEPISVNVYAPTLNGFMISGTMVTDAGESPFSEPMVVYGDWRKYTCPDGVTAIKNLTIAYEGGGVIVLMETFTDSINMDKDGNRFRSLSLCNFAGGKPSSKKVQVVSGNYGDGSLVVDGVTYTKFLKMESATEFKTTSSFPYTITLYYGSTDTKNNVMVDGVKKSGSNGILTINLDKGTHTFRKADAGTIYLIKIVEK